MVRIFNAHTCLMKLTILRSMGIRSPQKEDSSVVLCGANSAVSNVTAVLLLI